MYVNNYLLFKDTLETPLETKITQKQDNSTPLMHFQPLTLPVVNQT